MVDWFYYGNVKSNKKTRTDKSEADLQPTDLIYPVNSAHTLDAPRRELGGQQSLFILK